MTDIAMPWSNEAQSADIVLAGLDLLSDESWQTALTLSLGTDARATPDDVLPAGSTDRRGWWGDAFAEVEGDQIGNRLWLLKRRALTAETLRLVKDYTEQALAWMITDGVAKSIVVTVQRRALDQIARRIEITRPDGTGRVYDYVWSTL